MRRDQWQAKGESHLLFPGQDRYGHPKTAFPQDQRLDRGSGRDAKVFLRTRRGQKRKKGPAIRKRGGGGYFWVPRPINPQANRKRSRIQGPEMLPNLVDRCLQGPREHLKHFADGVDLPGQCDGVKYTRKKERWRKKRAYRGDSGDICGPCGSGSQTGHNPPR